MRYPSRHKDLHIKIRERDEYTQTTFNYKPVTLPEPSLPLPPPHSSPLYYIKVTGAGAHAGRGVDGLGVQTCGMVPLVGVFKSKMSTVRVITIPFREQHVGGNFNMLMRAQHQLFEATHTEIQLSYCGPLGSFSPH